MKLELYANFQLQIFILGLGPVLQFIHTLKQVFWPPLPLFMLTFVLIGCCSQTEGLNSMWAGHIKDNTSPCLI